MSMQREDDEACRRCATEDIAARIRNALTLQKCRQLPETATNHSIARYLHLCAAASDVRYEAAIMMTAT